MANKEYPESGMSFVFDDQGVFLPEKDPCLKRLQYVKACDFVSLYRKKCLGSDLIKLQGIAWRKSLRPHGSRSKQDRDIRAESTCIGL